YDNAKLKKFQKLIKNEFPILEENKGVVFEHKLKKGKGIESKSNESIYWRYTNKTRMRIVGFELDNIYIEFKKYNHSDDFFKITKLVMDSLFDIFPSIISTRLGLRYINQIKLDGKNPYDWNNLINKKLLDSMDFISNKKNMSRYITLIELNEEDYNLKFQYGIANSLYPSSIIKKEFILDYDCSTYESLEKTSEVLDKAKEFNEVITDMFEKSIGAGLRKKMYE
ncbi:MAG: TIGR04255 family protein, partial [Candidatus Aenigmarchaeota archaeon]|nr:TIGR04255 family protein [Candidatus Aenigmarchaeota archaeon]